MARVAAVERNVEDEGLDAMLEAGGRIGTVRDAHTHSSGRNALSDLGTKALVEGDVAFFKDAVEKL
jgi:microsomal dipeptidase-like Zn-dependent dipeptidase